MKLYGPDKSLLIEVKTVSTHPEGIVIEGKIMGAMPMKAILRPEELRGVFKLLTRSVVQRATSMLIQGKKSVAKTGSKK